MELVEIIKVIILGIVEGITEWLPISSTGHMILVDEYLQLNTSAAFKEMFFVVIQLGAIMSVVVLYWGKLVPLSYDGKIHVKKDTMSLWYKIIVACIPAAVIGLLFDDKIDEMFYNYQTVSVTLIIYGILFIVVENLNKGKQPKIGEISQIDYRTALLIGVFQVLAPEFLF